MSSLDPDLSAYDGLKMLFTIALGSFFREIKTRGSHKIPSEGPVLFVVAPHANQFVDPLMVITSCGREVGFLIAKKSMRLVWIYCSGLFFLWLFWS